MPYKSMQDRRQWWERNSARVNAVRKEQRAANPFPNRHHAREGRLLKMYGMKRGEYARRLAEQGGICAICGSPPVGGSHVTRSLHVDHDHETGMYRALLCDACNIGIGRFCDDPALCRAAAEYLEKHGSRPKPRACARSVEEDTPLFASLKEEHHVREA